MQDRKYRFFTPVIKHIKCLAGLDPASMPIPDSRFRGNDSLGIYCCRTNNIRTLVFFLFLFLYPSTAFSAPHEVTIFPDSALMMEVTKANLHTEGKNLQAVFVLPAQADPETLTTRLPEDSKLKIEDQMWRQIIRQDDAKISELRKKIEKVKTDRRSFQATIQSLNTQIQFWQLQTKAKTKTLADAGNMSVAIGKNMKKLFQDKLNEEVELEKLDKHLKELQDELERTTGKKETAWEVSVLLSGPHADETTLTYTYSLSECGWIPMYRLEAKPAEKKVLFSWEAEIWQSSGQDWNNIIANLATLKPVPSIVPPDLPPWIIKPRHEARKRAARVKDAEDHAEALAMAESVPSAPQEVRQSTYSIWQIGKKNLPAGLRQRVKLQDESWPAEFVYLIRPSLSPGAFVRASIRLPQSKDIPSGIATFMLDSAILGKRNFSFAGTEAALFFGLDPLVSAERILLSKKSGEKGILTDKQTYRWEWRIDIRNSRGDSARLMIEEPNPQPRDERIKMTLKHDPEPSEKTPSALIWNLDVEAGQKKSISSSVSLDAPGNMNLDLGWQ